MTSGKSLRPARRPLAAVTLVQTRQVADLRHGNKMIPSEVTALSFHAALLVPFPQSAELCSEVPVRAEGDDCFGLLSPATTQDRLHRRLDIVVPQSREDGPLQ